MTAEPRKKIGLTGGGSAGHALPALAVAAELIRLGHDDLLFFGRRDSIESRLASRDGVPFADIPAAALRRYFSPRNLLSPFIVVHGFVQSALLLRRHRVAVLFSKGSFVAVPVALAAWALRIPIVLHESDHSLGLANRLVARAAKEVLLAFDGTQMNQRVRSKARVVGQIVRPDLAKGNPSAFRTKFDIPLDRPVLLVFGGSSGAQRINSAVRANLPAIISHYSVIHIVGLGNIDPELADVRNYHQFDFLNDEMVDALWAADLVVARAGANTVAELTALDRRAILIPLPLSVSRGDQFENAAEFVEGGHGVVVRDEDMDSDLLPEILNNLDAHRLSRPVPAQNINRVAKDIAATIAAYLSP